MTKFAVLYSKNEQAYWIGGDEFGSNTWEGAMPI